MRSHTKPALPERRLLALWRQGGLGVRECARRLNRNPGTISRELQRNRLEREVYEPLCAQEKAERRKEQVFRSKHPLKNSGLYAYVLEKLEWGWSPEVIAGRLREVEHPGDFRWHICPETIYRFIYSPWAKRRFKDKPLWEYLRRKQKKRRRQTGRSVHRVRIPDRVSIHARPEEVGLRKVFGHWEGDSLVGARRLSGLHTAYDRVSSYIRMARMADMTSASSLLAQRQVYSDYPVSARKSTTLDNGLEHVLHKILEE